MRKRRFAITAAIAASLLVFALPIHETANNAEPEILWPSVFSDAISTATDDVPQQNISAAGADASSFSCPAAAGGVEAASDNIHDVMDRRERELDAIATKLSISQDPEHLLTAALLELDRDSPDRIDNLARALRAAPGNALILWNFLQTCSVHESAPICADQNITRQAIQADGANGALWGRIAVYRDERGESEGALEALKRANTSPGYNNYWSEHILAIERSFAATTSHSYPERILRAMGIAIMVALPETGIFKICKTNALRSSAWQRNCRAFGRRLETDSGTLLGTILGLELQGAMLELSNDAKAQAIVEGKLNELHRVVKDTVTTDAEFLLTHDTEVLSHFVTVLETDGELVAMQYVQREVARLQALPDYDPCGQ